MPNPNRHVDSELNNTATLLSNTAITSTGENDDTTPQSPNSKRKQAATPQSPNSKRKQEELATRNTTAPSLPNTAIARHAATPHFPSPEYRRITEELINEELVNKLFIAEARLSSENNKAWDEHRKNKEVCNTIRTAFADKDIIDEYIRAYDEFLQDENNKGNRITHKTLIINYGKDTRIYMDVVFTDTQKSRETISLIDEQFPIELNFKVKQHVDINPTIAEKNYKAAEEYAKQIVRQCNYQMSVEYEGEKNQYGQVRYQYNR